MAPSPPREDPITFPASSPPSDPGHSAALIFLHGLGDSAFGFSGIASQFQNANKLPHMRWLFANAVENRDAMQQAWYTPSSLSPFPSSRPELDDEEDEAGMLESVAYIVGLIDGLVAEGVPAGRIVLAGFSQGAAMSLLTALISPRHSGRLAGVAALSGYLPIEKRIQALRAAAGLPETVGEMPVFVARGTKDMLVPRRYLRICVDALAELGMRERKSEEEGSGDGVLEVHEYEGMGHGTSGVELRDLCMWLEKVVPPLE
ncbi:acyl-protein thioesterase 1 [Cryomyces antarcticus]